MLGFERCVLFLLGFHWCKGFNSTCCAGALKIMALQCLLMDMPCKLFCPIHSFSVLLILFVPFVLRCWKRNRNCWYIISDWHGDVRLLTPGWPYLALLCAHSAHLWRNDIWHECWGKYYSTPFHCLFYMWKFLTWPWMEIEFCSCCHSTIRDCRSFSGIMAFEYEESFRSFTWNWSSFDIEHSIVVKHFLLNCIAGFSFISVIMEFGRISNTS